MNHFKLKIVLAILSGVAFSFIFILLAFSLPSKEDIDINYKPKSKLEQVSHSIKNK